MEKTNVTIVLANAMVKKYTQLKADLAATLEEERERYPSEWTSPHYFGIVNEAIEPSGNRDDMIPLSIEDADGCDRGTINIRGWRWA